MRYPEGHKEAVRASIVAKAARALRKHGLEGVSIPAIMKQVGLTHGGFYSHFKNRDELVAAAIVAAGDETTASVFEEGGDQALNRYLSIEHVKHPEVGCIVAALGTEARYQGVVVRRAFASVARGLVLQIQKALSAKRGGCESDDESRQKALFAKTGNSELSDEALLRAAQMVGAVVLARVMDDSGLADRVLKVARAR
ncbi:MAG: TetR/AcrR family transcriptional regulator [Myxococcota bacterium]